MHGPVPKFKNTRARRGTPAGGEWTSLPPLAKPILPAVSKTAGASAWSARTRALWNGWRQDFATQTYGPSEIAMATELGFLVDIAITGGKVTAWSEALKWMDSLALTPKGKRDARIFLDEPVPTSTVQTVYMPSDRRPSARERMGPLLERGTRPPAPNLDD